jgi:hypothetical protein
MHAIAPVTTGDPPSAPPCRLHLLPRSSLVALSSRVGREEKSSLVSPSPISPRQLCHTACHRSAAPGATADALPSRVRAHRFPDAEWGSVSSCAVARSCHEMRRPPSSSPAKCLHVDGPLWPSFGPVFTSTISAATSWTSPAPLTGGPPLPLPFPSADPRRHGRAHR